MSSGWPPEEGDDRWEPVRHASVVGGAHDSRVPERGYSGYARYTPAEGGSGRFAQYDPPPRYDESGWYAPQDGSADASHPSGPLPGAPGYRGPASLDLYGAPVFTEADNGDAGRDDRRCRRPGPGRAVSRRGVPGLLRRRLRIPSVPYAGDGYGAAGAYEASGPYEAPGATEPDSGYSGPRATSPAATRVTRPGGYDTRGPGRCRLPAGRAAAAGQVRSATVPGPRPPGAGLPGRRLGSARLPARAARPAGPGPARLWPGGL